MGSSIYALEHRMQLQGSGFRTVVTKHTLAIVLPAIQDGAYTQVPPIAEFFS